ncbi:HupE/UreJ family protein [Microbulbifer hainanensis]|uniref:HupE/UreJ family protein n=1 Tax=Microbulbifer hainanensis TaxID=2735675 RepID=UPI0018683E54|nr:HupE/UreJ family protein [Microbulbifer hainanensis]
MKARLLTLLAVSLICGAVSAHENRLLQVQIDQLNDQLYGVRLQVPPSVAPDNQPSVQMPVDCRARSEALYYCAQPLQGQTLEIRYARYNPSVSTLIQLHWLSGETRYQVLAAEDAQWTVPAPETVAGIASEYFRLGVIHILAGWDHLLFLFCLLLLAAEPRRVVMTLSGFTLAHSLTMVAAALEWVQVPVAAVEAVIALSVLFLARELLGNRRDSYTFRYPVLVSVSFGLIHGFGFAAALAEIGLPQTALVTGLTLFNLGVEAGQLLLALAWLAVVSLVRPRWSPERFRQPALYLMGIVAGYWFVERSLGVALLGLS